jgi:hypothetical protein
MDDSDKGGAGPDAAGTTDPEILKLLDFEPVARRHKRGDGWTPALQRIFIARLAELGSVNAATEALGKNRYGVEKLYKSAGADSFRAAWDKAIALFEEREAKRIAAENAPFAGVKPPFVDKRKARATEAPDHAPPGPRADPLPVICDKCRSEGAAGDAAFAEIPDILAFDPVPRRAHDRLWPADVQRAFIAALAVSGSPVRAARSVSRHAFGAEKLRKARGSRSFCEAWEAALDLARERELTRLHGSLEQLSEKIDASGGRVEDEQEHDEEAIEEVRQRLFDKLQRLRRKKLREEIIPDAEKRAAWVVLNGQVEIDEIEGGSTEGKTSGGEADAST